MIMCMLKEMHLTDTIEYVLFDDKKANSPQQLSKVMETLGVSQHGIWEESLHFV